MSNDKNKIEELFEIQTKFTEKLFREKYGINVSDLTHEQKIKWSKEYILSGAKEMFEMLDELNWKTHRYLNKSDNMDNFIEEGIDAFKFLLNLFIINGFTADDFYTKFFEKSIVVDIRYEQEKQLKNIKESDKKYVVIDIDGVLNQYPRNVMEFFKKEGAEYPALSDFKRSNLQQYTELKYKYRVTGQERNCYVNNDAIDFIKKVKAAGYGIILLTARPYHKMTRLFFDTFQWLEDKGIDFDFLFFAKDKEQYLLNNIDTQYIKCVIDDQIENTNKLAEYFTTYLLFNDQLYRNLDMLSSKVIVINNLNQIEL